MAIGPKKDGGGGRGWWESLAGRQGGNFIVGGETDFLVDGHFLRQLLAGRPFAAF